MELNEEESVGRQGKWDEQVRTGSGIYEHHSEGNLMDKIYK